MLHSTQHYGKGRNWAYYGECHYVDCRCGDCCGATFLLAWFPFYAKKRKTKSV